MPVPPNIGRWPQPAASTQQHYFKLSRRNPAANDQFDETGPFLCRHVAADGSLQLPSDKGNKDVVIDERLWMPLASGADERAVVTNMQTGQQSTIAFVKRFGDEIECYIVHRGPT